MGTVLFIFVETRKLNRNRSKSRSGSSTNSSISTNEMKNMVEKLKMESKRTSTRKNYYCVWRTFNEFFIKLDVKPESWEERLTLFVAYLVKDNKKSQTIRSYISAIKSILREDDVILNENKYLLTAMTKACKLQNDHVRTRLPIKQRMLNMLLKCIFEHFELEMGQYYLSKLYRAMFASAYYGLLRIGEITAGNHPIFATDVHIASNKKKIMFTLHTSKTHWTDVKPQIVKIFNYKKENSTITTPNINQNLFCPYQILRDYASVRPTCKSLTEPFFVYGDRSAVQSRQLRKILKATLALSGFEPKLYNFQSFRIGHATQLMENNFSVETIKILGRWKSNIVYSYLRE